MMMISLLLVVSDDKGQGKCCLFVLYEYKDQSECCLLCQMMNARVSKVSCVRL